MTVPWKYVISNTKYVILALILLITYHLSLITPAFAQASAPSVAPLQPTAYSLPPVVSPTSPLYTDLLVNNLFHSFSCLAIGQSMIGQPCLSYQITKNAQGMMQGIPVLSQVNTSGGVLGTTTNLIGMLYQNPPVKTADYLASVGQDLGIVKEAHAQVGGSGAAVLNPILTLWQASRNISYVIMIVIFLIIGLMVMFRNRINPQTVITAQTALPGLVIGLILITFSYFLAGLISDMAFVGTNVVGYYFSAVKEQTDKPQNLVQEISSNGDNVLSLFGRFSGIVTQDRAETAARSVFDQLGDAQNVVRTVVFWLTAQFVMPLGGVVPPPWGLIAAPITALFSGAVVNIGLPFFLGFFLSFAAALALIYQMIKLLLRLITAYLTIIFLTISAPFQFLIASLPGRQGMATGWILSMLGNILIFPAVIAVFYFVAFILGQDYGPFKVSAINSIKDSAIIPTAYAANQINVVDSATFPLFGGMELGFIRILLAFGALMALPSIPDIITRSVGKAGQAGQMIGQEIMGGSRAGQGYAQRTYMAGIGWGQQANTMIRGEKGLVFDPRTGEYVQGITRGGFTDWLTAKKPEKGPAGGSSSTGGSRRAG